MKPLYDNSGGSALLFEARAGALRTLAYHRRFYTSADVARAICRICGTEEEITEHIVLRCADLCPGHLGGTTYSLALGFRGDAEKSTVVARVVYVTKQRLVQCRRRTRRQCRRADNVDV
ncbi:hypothetical protein HPB51_019947 [Rhipicephalus microplus]|uniref:Tick transposon n=1 Tax=Rhipicephalus microplus TaxID=6941 RepID=A0A9J6E3N0_RHIMP|nr:hypothetical protein HPB51_019947 [Rhipicephalus microplus]